MSSGPEIAAARKAAAARVLHERMDAHSISRPLLAAHLGVSKSLVQSWCDADDDCAMPLAHVGAIPCEGLKLDLVERALGPEYCVTRIDPDAETVDASAIAQVASSGGGLVADLITACADGRITRAEAAELRLALEPYIRSLVSLKLALAQIEADWVSNVRKGKK